MNVYFGVVEARGEDPQRACRYKVRVLGIHSQYVADVPTNELPWAIPIQNNSAAMSGIGTSANGYLQGSTVAVIFVDEDFQIPLIIGAIGGVQGQISQQTQLSNAIDNKVIPNTSSVASNTIGTLTVAQVDILKATIAKAESGTKGYSAENNLGFLGKYQFGATFLEDVGYIVKGSYARIKNNLKVVSEPLNWTGKDGVSSKELFLQNSDVQEICMNIMLSRNYNKLCANDCLSSITPPEKTAGILMTAHLKGAGLAGATGYVKLGNNSTDAYGTSCEKYYRIGYTAICGKPTSEVPTKENINVPAIDRNT
jgi:hypothetical protein